MQKPAEMPPRIMVPQLAYVMRASRALYAAAQLAIADVLADGPLTTAELARRVEADPSSLRRLMTALVALGVFEEVDGDRFQMNEASDLLRSNVPVSQRAAVLYLAGDASWELWSDFLECVRTGQPVSDRDIGKNIFERQQQNKEESRLFEQAMTSFSAALSQPIIDAYDFQSCRHITDVGGGNGRLLTDILKSAPQAKGTLFDQPGVVANAIMADEGVGDRSEAVGGSFFESVPAGADVFVIKGVIHDWDDESCIAILTRIRAAMTPQSKLVIVDRIVPERATKGVAVDIHLLDLEMLVGSPSGRERKQAEFADMLTAAGLKLSRVIPTRSPVSLIEAQPA